MQSPYNLPSINNIVQDHFCCAKYLKCGNYDKMSFKLKKNTPKGQVYNKCLLTQATIMQEQMDKLTNYALSFPMISLTSPIHCQLVQKKCRQVLILFSWCKLMKSIFYFILSTLSKQKILNLQIIVFMKDKIFESTDSFSFLLSFYAFIVMFFFLVITLNTAFLKGSCLIQYEAVIDITMVEKRHKHTNWTMKL